MASLRPFLAVGLERFLVLGESSLADVEGAGLVNWGREGESARGLEGAVKLGLEAEDVVSGVVEVFLAGEEARRTFL